MNHIYMQIAGQQLNLPASLTNTCGNVECRMLQNYFIERNICRNYNDTKNDEHTHALQSTMQ